MNLLPSRVKNLVNGNGRMWFIYTKERLLTQHIWEFCKCDQAMGTRLPALQTHKLLSILNLVAHCTWGKGRGRLLHCTRAKLLFGRLVSLTAIWRGENYYKCSNAECQCSCIQNDSNHTQSCPPGWYICTCGDWIMPNEVWTQVNSIILSITLLLPVQQKERRKIASPTYIIIMLSLLIRASLREPHTSVTALQEACMCALVHIPKI